MHKIKRNVAVMLLSFTLLGLGPALSWASPIPAQMATPSLHIDGSTALEHDPLADSAPTGIVPAGDWFKSKASCEARGRYLLQNPPPLMRYTGFTCVRNLYNDRWSLLMESPDVGCGTDPQSTEWRNSTKGVVPTCG